jgi:hypothetical protein
VSSDAARARELHRQVHGMPGTADSKGILLTRDDIPVAATLYDSYNGANIFAHLAIQPGGRLTREFIKAIFYYPFVQLGCLRITGLVDVSNQKARLLNKHLGFQPEAVLKRAAEGGQDMMVYVMFREDCRYVSSAPQRDQLPGGQAEQSPGT